MVYQLRLFQRQPELQLLKEAGTQSIAFHQHRFDRYQCDIAQIKLQTIKSAYVVPRLMRDVGTFGEKESPYLWGADLRDTKDVITIATVKLSPATKRKMIEDATGLGYMEPRWDVNLLKQGITVIDMLWEYTRRGALRDMGLVDVEEKQAQNFGSYDELCQLMAQAYTESKAIYIQLATQQAMQLAGGQIPPAQAAIPPQGWNPEQGLARQDVQQGMSDMRMSFGQGMPAIPMGQGRTPVEDVAIV